VTPIKLLERDENRYSWDITNVGAGIVYYMRGQRGRQVAIAGEAQGVPVAANATDGYDERDAIDEVWIIAVAAQNVILHVTYDPGWYERERTGGARAIGRRR